MPVYASTKKRASIWMALAVALALHAVILLLPVTKYIPVSDEDIKQIEVQLVTFSQPVPEQEPEMVTPAPVPEPIPEPAARLSKSITEAQAEDDPPVLAPSSLPGDLVYDSDKLGEQDKGRLADFILSRQFITEESAADKLFGKPPEQQHTQPQREFHYPARQDMIAMLDQPMGELPFAYTPGLVHFAYDPGVKGELQRFWDVITPEFGWRTNNGTEFKCIWVLVIAACGWK